MSAELVPSVTRFKTALDNLDVSVTHTESESFAETLRAVVDDSEAVVGTPLPFTTVSLPSWVDDDPTPATLKTATTGISSASLGIADYGSVVLISSPEGSELVSLFPGLHVVILRKRDLITDISTAIEHLGPELRAGGSAVVATGPSATADMGSLVKGAHGPKEVHVVLLEDGADDATDRGES